MSKMSDLHIELVEMVESGISYEFIESLMVDMGFLQKLAVLLLIRSPGI